MKSKPWIIWLQPGVWLAIYTAILVLNIFLDNAVSSLFAGMGTGAEHLLKSWTAPWAWAH